MFLWTSDVLLDQGGISMNDHLNDSNEIIAKLVDGGEVSKIKT